MLSEGEVKNKRYKVSRVLGQGGTSCVYLVIDIKIRKYWAMKEISKSNSLGAVLAKREIDMLKSIDFHMFPRIVDAFDEPDNLYIISDYVEGMSLDRVIKIRSIGKTQCIKWAKEILDALEYLHGLSPPILYLDLKPENILLSPTGRLYLVDFGIAGRITAKIYPLGTPGYAAPEQYGNNTVTNRTDIFGFGATYYSIRLGRTPNKNPASLIESIKKDKVLSKKEKEIIINCIMPDPKDRYSTIEVVKQSLNQIKTNQSKSKRIFTLIELLMIVSVFAGALAGKTISEKRQKDAAREMIGIADRYMDDGEYTYEGIKIITSFINSGCLSKEVEDQFSLEVAINLFEVQKNYREALVYFEKLDPNEYPEAEYYSKLCKLQMSFEVDNEEIIKCVGKLYGCIYMEGDSIQKYENMLFISRCYETYESSRIDGINKAITVLEESMDDIERIAVETGEDEYISLINEYETRLSLLYKKADMCSL